MTNNTILVIGSTGKPGKRAANREAGGNHPRLGSQAQPQAG
jgi:hypothetical protein